MLVRALCSSDHDMPVAENILNRNFVAERPGQKMVSDITYIPTDEGWLYLAGVMDLCGRKMIGVAMDSLQPGTFASLAEARERYMRR
ncbi:MAG: hypothetical protein IIW84_10500 [Selenomonadaceae bacterium]|nr:hypothetical protein [Selenomonadaceae bacterium]MBQ5921468.1 hypothetical protein [Selenomonadaceae bacterium]